MLDQAPLQLPGFCCSALQSTLSVHLPVFLCVRSLIQCVLDLYYVSVCVSLGVDMCGRTVMVVVGRNIPVTLIDIEKVRHCTH